MRRAAARSRGAVAPSVSPWRPAPPEPPRRTSPTSWRGGGRRAGGRRARERESWPGAEGRQARDGREGGPRAAFPGAVATASGVSSGPGRRPVPPTSAGASSCLSHGGAVPEKGIYRGLEPVTRKAGREGGRDPRGGQERRGGEGRAPKREGGREGRRAARRRGAGGRGSAGQRASRRSGARGGAPLLFPFEADASLREAARFCHPSPARRLWRGRLLLGAGAFVLVTLPLFAFATYTRAREARTPAFLAAAAAAAPGQLPAEEPEKRQSSTCGGLPGRAVPRMGNTIDGDGGGAKSASPPSPTPNAAASLLVCKQPLGA